MAKVGMENMKKIELNLNSIESYKQSSLEQLKYKLIDYFDNWDDLNLETIKEKVNEFNSYPNFEHLKPLDKSQVIILDEKETEIEKAEEAILLGEFFWEHAAAGEATRLNLGTKYVICPSQLNEEEIMGMIINEARASDDQVKLNNINEIKKDLVSPQSLLPISLGTRHMLQMIYDVTKLAKKYNLDPNEVLKKQKTLIILNKTTAERIINEFKTYSFFNLEPMNVYFMVQEDFHGISLKGKEIFFEEVSGNKRLHNHGQMAMQKLHEKVIFHFVDGKKMFIDFEDYSHILNSCKDLLSYNIEDIGYLTSAVDYPSLALALKLGEHGYDMVMEIVGQNPLKPQKGGAAFYDSKLNKNVMVEVSMLKDYKLEEIKYLNKNFNHYPNPANSILKLKEGLPMPIAIKNSGNKDFIYFCPIQGDINFLVKTAFIMRKELKPIFNWKSPATTPLALKTMLDQDKQLGFKDLAKSLGVIQ